MSGFGDRIAPSNLFVLKIESYQPIKITEAKMITTTSSKSAVSKRILVIDSISGPLQRMSEQFRQLGCDVSTSLSPLGALDEIVHLEPKAVLLNLDANTDDSFRFLERMKASGNGTPVVVIAEDLSAETAIQVMKLGAYEYFPVDAGAERIIDVVEHLTTPSKGLDTMHTRQKHALTPNELVGNSPEMMEIAKLIGQVAETDASVLIMGESGTGKELIARLIYGNSTRREKPFMSVNSAAGVDIQLTSEMFGHERGAFAGAYSRKIGKFEQCDGGTIFLDDVADMSLAIQSKILRVLQDRRFERAGGDQTIDADVRIIAATNKSLVKAIKENSFRVDLFYRLKVVSIYLPPLRERKQDIPLLVDFFLDRYCEECQRVIDGIDPEAVDQLMEYSWPGNVRELENNIHTAVVMCKERIILPKHLPVLTETRQRVNIAFEELEEGYTQMFDDLISPVFDRVASVSSGRVYQHMMSAMERTLYSAALKHCRSNQVKASTLLGVSRNTLRDRVKKFGLY